MLRGPRDLKWGSSAGGCRMAGFQRPPSRKRGPHISGHDMTMPDGHPREPDRDAQLVLGLPQLARAVHSRWAESLVTHSHRNPHRSRRSIQAK